MAWAGLRWALTRGWATPSRLAPGIRESALLVWESLVAKHKQAIQQEGNLSVKTSSSRRSRGGRGRTAKQRLRRKLASEARSVDRRLKAAVVPNFSGPVLGRANIVYELAERSRGVAHGGMGMVARLVKKLGLAEEVDSSVHLLSPAQALLRVRPRAERRL